MTGFEATRWTPPGVHPLRSVFTGVELSPAFAEVIPDEAARGPFLDAALVSVDPGHGFMWVNDEDGVLHVSQSYLETGELRCLYLDVVHELTHVRQFHLGLELFDENFEYVDRPTEIEAYAISVREALRLEMVLEEIMDYLVVPWISPEEHVRLARACGLDVPDPPMPE